MPPSSFPTLQLLIALVESTVPCPINIAHAVWFSPTGAVEGHFYMKEKRTDLASSALHFSVNWPPSDAPSTERGENQLTRRRRQRRAVFEAFTGSAQHASAVSGTSSSFRGMSAERLPQDIVAVVVHPPNGLGIGGQTTVDYLNAQRLQQFCDLPPIDVSDTAELSAGGGAGQEAILLRFPQALSASYRFTTTYVSSHGVSGIVATELREAKTLISDSATPIAERTDAVRSLRVAGGTRRRLGEIGQTCCSAFPDSWWQASHKQRLGMFCLVEYNSSVHHVERFTFLCAIAAPLPSSMLQKSRRLNATATATLRSEAPPSTHRTQLHQQRGQGPLTSEDISWTLDEGRTVPLPTSQEQGLLHRDDSSDAIDNRTYSHRQQQPQQQRWTFVKHRGDGDGTRRVSEPFATANDGNGKHRTLSPSSFVEDAVPTGRYTADGDATNLVFNRPSASSTVREPWQRYNLQRYDVEGSSRRAHHADHHSTSSLVHAELPPEGSPELPEHELLQEHYIEGLRDGSMFGYLVDATLPIGRDPHIAPLHHEAEHRSPTSLGREDRKQLVSSEPPDTYQSCLSSQSLRHLRETELRNPMVTKTADPFIRVRRGLLPAIARASGKAHANKKKPPLPVPLAPRDLVLDDTIPPSDAPPSIATSPVRPTITICESSEWQPPERHLQQGGGGGAPAAPSVLHAVMFRKTFLDRFVEAVDAVEALARRPDSGSNNASTMVLAEQTMTSATGTVRRPPGQIGFSFGTGSMVGGTPLTRSMVAGCGGVEGKGGDTSPLTPRRLLLQSMRMEAVKQCWEDVFYTIYSQHGGPPMTQYRAQNRELPHLPVVTVRLASRVDASEALEHVHWLHVLNPSLGAVSVFVSERRKAADHGSRQCEGVEQEASGVEETMFDITLKVVNTYAAIALIKTRLEHQAAAVEAFLRQEDCNAHVLTALRKQQHTERDALLDALSVPIRQHREALVSAAAASEAVPSTSTQQHRRPSQKNTNKNDGHAEHDYAPLDVTRFFTECSSKLSLIALCVEEMGPDFPLRM